MTKLCKNMEILVDKPSELCDNPNYIHCLPERTEEMAVVYFILRCSLMFCLAGAGLWDLWARRVPNRWLTFWFVIGFGCFALSSWLAVAGYLVRCAVTVSVFFLFFLCRMMGAGDIKCMALICGYLGFASGVFVIITGMVVGACWSLTKLLYHRQLWERFGFLSAYFRRIFQEKRWIAYYVPGRDGREVTLPLVFCLFWGFCVFLLVYPC